MANAERVLLVEDEPNIIESIRFLLERAGFDVSVESNGQRALDQLLEDSPRVLVLDVMLPDMDGYEILRQLRSDTRTAELPVLMLTAKGQREDRETALKCGANMFMTKPFANADVVAAVRRLAFGDAA